MFFFSSKKMDAALLCKRFNINPPSSRKVYLCAIHKQGPLNDPLECTKCPQYEIPRDEATAECIILNVDTLPEGQHQSFEVGFK